MKKAFKVKGCTCYICAAIAINYSGCRKKVEAIHTTRHKKALIQTWALSLFGQENAGEVGSPRRLNVETFACSNISSWALVVTRIRKSVNS